MMTYLAPFYIEWILDVTLSHCKEGARYVNIVSLGLINFGWLISKEFVPNIKRFLPPSYLSNETIQN